MLQRKSGSVFVNIIPPASVQQQSEAARQGRVWAKVATAIAESEEREPSTAYCEPPPIEEVFAKALPNMIEASRWGRYISPGPAPHIRDNRTFVYHNPCDNFWDLYNLAKGIFRDIGIRMAKQKGIWVAHIPIRVLTDKVFVASGLAAVEKALMQHTGIDPVAILQEIRQRQFAETAKVGVK